MGEACDRCKSVGEDRRTLWMACFYEMGELGLPFEVVRLRPEGYDHDRAFYTLRVCKRCRAEWMAAIKAWFEATPKGGDHDSETPPESIGSGIFVRENGAIREVTREEWDARFAKGPIGAEGDE